MNILLGLISALLLCVLGACNSNTSSAKPTEISAKSNHKEFSASPNTGKNNREDFAYVLQAEYNLKIQAQAISYIAKMGLGKNILWLRNTQIDSISQIWLDTRIQPFLNREQDAEVTVEGSNDFLVHIKNRLKAYSKLNYIFKSNQQFNQVLLAPKQVIDLKAHKIRLNYGDSRHFDPKLLSAFKTWIYYELPSDLFLDLCFKDQFYIQINYKARKRRYFQRAQTTFTQLNQVLNQYAKEQTGRDIDLNIKTNFEISPKLSYPIIDIQLLKKNHEATKSKNGG